MKILNNASEKINKYNNTYPHYHSVYKEILDARFRGNSLVATNGSVSAKKLEVIDEGLRRFDMARWMVEREQFISALRDILERDELKKILVKLRDLRITHINLAEIEKDTKELYEALSIRNSGFTTSGSAFWVGATKIMNFLFPELLVMLDKNVAKAVLNLRPPQYYNFTQYWKTMNICWDELIEWQKSCGSTESLLKLDLKPTTLIRIFDKCAFIEDVEG